jgi:FixJ family two-component response regulator
MPPAESHVVIVDDDPDVCDALRFLLEADGRAACGYASAPEFLRAAPDSHIACLVLDYRLPDRNGLDLARQARALGISAPILLIAGSPDAGLQQRAQRLGIRHVLAKPLAEDRLLDAIRDSLAAPQDPGNINSIS